MEWVVSATPRPHYSRKRDAVPIVYEAVWTTGTVWAGADDNDVDDDDNYKNDKAIYLLVLCSI